MATVATSSHCTEVTPTYLDTSAAILSSSDQGVELQHQVPAHTPDLPIRSGAQLSITMRLSGVRELTCSEVSRNSLRFPSAPPRTLNISGLMCRNFYQKWNFFCFLNSHMAPYACKIWTELHLHVCTRINLKQIFYFMFQVVGTAWFRDHCTLYWSINRNSLEKTEALQTDSRKVWKRNSLERMGDGLKKQIPIFGSRRWRIHNKENLFLAALGERNIKLSVRGRINIVFCVSAKAGGGGGRWGELGRPDASCRWPAADNETSGFSGWKTKI